MTINLYKTKQPNDGDYRLDIVAGTKPAVMIRLATKKFIANKWVETGSIRLPAKYINPLARGILRFHKRLRKEHYVDGRVS